MAVDLGQISKPSIKDHIFMEKVGPRQAIILTLKQKYTTRNYLKKFQAGIVNNKQNI